MQIDKLNEFTAGLDTTGKTTYGDWGNATGGVEGWTYSKPILVGNTWMTTAHKTDQTTPAADKQFTGTLNADGTTVAFADGQTAIVFEREASQDGIAYTDVLDWGTDGNELGSIRGEGHHHDDVMRLLSWFVWAVTACTGTLTVTWQTSDDKEFGAGNVDEIAERTVGAAEIAKGTYLVNGDPLPKGLKRYQRLKVTSNAGSPSGKVGAFVVNVQGA